MPIDAKRTRLTFQKLGRELSKLTRKPVPETVHKFRTNSRRVEALLSELVPELSRNDRKLLKSLARLRKKAGRVRDLDVEIGCLRNLKIPGGNGQRTQFLNVLLEDRAIREERLSKAFTPKVSALVQKRLKRAAKEVEAETGTDPLTITLQRLAQLARAHTPLTETTLHQYRIIGKRARYVAELADEDPKAKRLVEQLKHLQDIIGDWHDWLKLTQKAERLFGGVPESVLVAMLRNISGAKFRQSTAAVAEARTAIAAWARPQLAEAAPGRKPPKKSPHSKAAVA